MEKKNLQKKHIPKSPHHLENFLLQNGNGKGQKHFYFSSVSEEKGETGDRKKNPREKPQQAVSLPKDCISTSNLFPSLHIASRSEQYPANLCSVLL